MAEMQKVLLTATIAVSLTISTIVIICSLDGLAVCGPGQDNSVRFYTYKDYCILPYVSKNCFEENLDIYERITLTFHLSYNYLDEKIIEQVEAWDGPITLTIMIPSENIFAHVREIQAKLASLPRKLSEKISCHLIFHSRTGCELNSISGNQTLKPAPTSAYPVNVVRNAARMFIRSKYVLMADYEFVFSNGFESRMRKLAQRELSLNPKTVLVFRIFEVDAKVPTLPRNKTELQALMKKGEAVEFHANFTSNAHRIPGLSKWFKQPESTGAATISADLLFNRHDWEPQFVSLNTVPMHDENFPFSIRDNTVLRWEMCRMGYRFALVNDLFMVHRGIKSAKDARKTRGQQINAISRFKSALKKFNKRMDQNYPDTKSKCPVFKA